MQGNNYQLYSINEDAETLHEREAKDHTGRRARTRTRFVRSPILIHALGFLIGANPSQAAPLWGPRQGSVLTTRRSQVKPIPGMFWGGSDRRLCEPREPLTFFSRLPSQQRAQPGWLCRLYPASATVTADWEAGQSSPRASRDRPLLRLRTPGAIFSGSPGRLGELCAL